MARQPKNVAPFPRPRMEPPIPTAARYSKVETCRAIIVRLDSGDFAGAANLVEQMLWNARVRGVVETRLNGLIGTPIRWEPARDNAAGRRAAKAVVEDWPLIASDAVRKQRHMWGLNLGVAFLQKHWFVSESSGRLIPRLQMYHPVWANWDWSKRAYTVSVDGGQTEVVESPSLQRVKPEGLGLWVVHEPFGQHSWRHGLVHSAWYSWLGHEWSGRDQSRASEKLGIGIIKAKYPAAKSATDAASYVAGLRNLNAEGVVPCPTYEDGQAYDAEPLEFAGNGYEMIHRTKDSKAVDLAVLYLGHNLTTEAKGGSYAAANIGELIRSDIKTADAKAEAQTDREQVLADWAEANFGDPELAPIPVYETDPPAINETAARTLQQLSQAVGGFRNSGANVDAAALLERFRVPMVAVTAPMQDVAPMPDAPQQMNDPAPAPTDGGTNV